MVTSIIVTAELRCDCAKKGSSKLLASVEVLLETIPVLALESPAEVEYGRIRAELEAAGQTIGMNDLLIASHACAVGLTLVTDNTGKLDRIQGLKVGNWLRD